MSVIPIATCVPLIEARTRRNIRSDLGNHCEHYNGPNSGSARESSRGENLMADKRLLVILDGSPISKRAVKYVASWVGRRRGFRLCLAHVLPPLPAGLLEHGGF